MNRMICLQEVNIYVVRQVFAVTNQRNHDGI